MELALSESNILKTIFQTDIVEYYKNIKKYQFNIQKVLHNNCKTSEAFDIKTFFPQLPIHGYVSKKWNTVFKEVFQDFCKEQKIPLNFIIFYEYRDHEVSTEIDNILYMNPSICITKNSLETAIVYKNNLDITELYQTTFFKDQKKDCTNFNLFLLTALQIAFNKDIIYQSKYLFFYQLFFNGPLNNNFKSSFFNYLVSDYPYPYTAEKIISIAFKADFSIREEKNFWKLYDKLTTRDPQKAYCTFNDTTKTNIFLKLGFTIEEIEKNNHRVKNLLEKLDEIAKTKKTHEEMKTFEKEFETLVSYCIENQVNEWYFLWNILKWIDATSYTWKKLLKFLNIGIFFLQQHYQKTKNNFLSHEAIAKDLKLINYVNYYKDQFDTSLHSHYINPHYTFDQEIVIESKTIKNPSLILMRMTFLPLEKFIYFNEIESLTKKETQKQYPFSMITDTNIIIFLLKKYSTVNAYDKKKTLNLLEQLLNIPSEITPMIEEDTTLSKALKNDHALFKKNNHTTLYLFIEQLLPDLKKESPIIKLEQPIEKKKQNDYLQFFKKNYTKILIHLITFSILVTLSIKTLSMITKTSCNL